MEEYSRSPAVPVAESCIIRTVFTVTAQRNRIGLTQRLVPNNSHSAGRFRFANHVTQIADPRKGYVDSFLSPLDKCMARSSCRKWRNWIAPRRLRFQQDFVRTLVSYDRAEYITAVNTFVRDPDDWYCVRDAIGPLIRAGALHSILFWYHQTDHISWSQRLRWRHFIPQRNPVGFHSFVGILNGVMATGSVKTRFISSWRPLH